MINTGWTVLTMSKASEMKIVDFTNIIDQDEVAHIEPPHLDLHCLPSSLRILVMI